jgi:hypothetical protein
MLAMRDKQLLVTFGNHVIAWDTRIGVITDSDPAYPLTLPATAETVAALQIVRICKVHEVVVRNRSPTTTTQKPNINHNNSKRKRSE